MSSDPTFPILVKYSATRQRWQSTWYDASGIRHSKTFGYADDTSAKLARARYDNWMMNFRARPDIQNPTGPDAAYTVVRLAAQYLRYARTTYRKEGKPTSHVWNIRMAMRDLRDAYGFDVAASVDAPRLAALRDSMIFGKGQKGEEKVRTAKTVNGRLAIIQQAFKWAREKGRIPAAVYEDLKAVSRLRKNRSAAKESVPVKSIHFDFVEAIFPHVPEVVRDMVKLLNLNGWRPQEVCLMRGSDLEAGGPVWLYRPGRHKLQHLEDEGEVIRFVGPRSQEIIKRHLKANTAAYLFSPRDAHAERLDAKRKARKTKLWPSHAKKKKENPTGRFGDHYTTETFRRAIHYACKKAGIKSWNPGQLRHAVGTQMRKRYGIEDASVQLGHKHLSTTEIYAEKNAQRAMQIALEVG